MKLQPEMPDLWFVGMKILKNLVSAGIPKQAFPYMERHRRVIMPENSSSNATCGRAPKNLAHEVTSLHEQPIARSALPHIGLSSKTVTVTPEITTQYLTPYEKSIPHSLQPLT
jgi:hypothetical protein